MFCPNKGGIGGSWVPGIMIFQARALGVNKGEPNGARSSASPWGSHSKPCSTLGCPSSTIFLHKDTTSHDCTDSISKVFLLLLHPTDPIDGCFGRACPDTGTLGDIDCQVERMPGKASGGGTGSSLGNAAVIVCGVASLVASLLSFL